MNEKIETQTSARFYPSTLKKAKSVKITKHESYDEIFNRVLDYYIERNKTKIMDL